MHIGLLTYHHTTNFGSLLQTYGLYRSVKELGYECEIIDYCNETIARRETPIRLKNCRTVRDLVHYFIRQPAKRKKERAFERFVKDEMSLSPEHYNSTNITGCTERYDKFLVGSDLVWDFSINDSDTVFMLDFLVDGKKKVAYASSTGSIWTEREKVSRLLNTFSHIGVRERAIADTLNDWLDKKVDFVCDPTMLIGQDVWISMATSQIIKGKYIICYFMDKEQRIYKEAMEYGKKKGIPVYVIAYHKIPKGMRAIHPVTINEFLSLLYYADTVFTASYHGMLFSLYFNKEFYYYNRGWRSRMESIADYLDIRDREGLNGIAKELDYTRINALMQKLREDSKNKLSGYLLE